MTQVNHKPCDGCERGLPIHLGMHTGEGFYLPCSLPQFELQPIERDAWYQPQKKSLKSVPFVFGGSI